MAIRLGLILCASIGLSGCGAGFLTPSRPADPAYFFGALTDEGSANGLAFDDGSQGVADVEGNAMTVKLVRFQHDYETGETRLIISDETVTLPVTFTDYVDRDATVTLDGVPLVFVDGDAVLANGQTVSSYMNYRMEHSGTGSIYAYSKFGDPVDEPIDMEGFYAFGHETAPSDLAARSDRVTYAGSYFGYVQVLDLEGALVDDEVRTIGAITMQADFAEPTVSGRLSGQLDPLGDAESYEMIFLAAPIAGNGFVGSADLTCPSGSSCTSNTYVGGTFFGPDGEEISGVIGFDETVTAETAEDSYQLIGAAGFSSTQSVED